MIPETLIKRLAAAATVKQLASKQKASTQLSSIPWRRARSEAAGHYDKLVVMLEESDKDLFRDELRKLLGAMLASKMDPLKAAQKLVLVARGD